MRKLQDFLKSLLGVETEPTFIQILTLIRQIIIKDNHDTLSRKKYVCVHVLCGHGWLSCTEEIRSCTHICVSR